MRKTPYQQALERIYVRRRRAEQAQAQTDAAIDRQVRARRAAAEQAQAETDASIGRQVRARRAASAQRRSDAFDAYLQTLRG